MNTLDVRDIQEDLSFTTRQRRLWVQTEAERLLFAKDPYVYFYEDFLKAYDKAMRKSRGVFLKHCNKFSLSYLRVCAIR